MSLIALRTFGAVTIHVIMTKNSENMLILAIRSLGTETLFEPLTHSILMFELTIFFSAFIVLEKSANWFLLLLILHLIDIHHFILIIFRVILHLVWLIIIIIHLLIIYLNSHKIVIQSNSKFNLKNLF